MKIEKSITEQIFELHVNEKIKRDKSINRDKDDKTSDQWFENSEPLPQREKDKLDKLFKLQAQLNEKLNVTTGSKADIHIAREVLRLSRSLMHEVMELENELQLSWKYWKKTAKIDIPKAREEAIDCLFFLISIFQQLEMTPNDIYKEYSKKHYINVQRQEKGY